MKHTKVAIVGSGSVGCTIAYTIILKNLFSEIILIDINEKKCEGEVRDLSDTLPFSEVSKIRKGCIEDAGKADVTIIAAGIPQKPNQSRLELFENNKKIIESILKNMNPINNNLIIIIVTNPVDILTLVTQEKTSLPRSQIIGSGTLLDTQRLKGYLSEKLSIAEQSININVLGEHGDSQFATWSCANVSGKPIKDFPEISSEDLNKLENLVKKEVYKIIEHKGSTYYGVASCVAETCENIIFNQKRVFPVSCYSEKFKVCLSLPAILGEKGIIKILELPLSKEEEKKLEESANNLKKYKI